MRWHFGFRSLVRSLRLLFGLFLLLGSGIPIGRLLVNVCRFSLWVGLLLLKLMMILRRVISSCVLGDEGWELRDDGGYWIV